MLAFTNCVSSAVFCFCRGEGRPLHSSLCSPSVLSVGPRAAGQGEINILCQNNPVVCSKIFCEDETVVQVPSCFGVLDRLKDLYL